MSKVAKIVVIFSYLAAVGFGLAAIIKFKQHKDNPVQNVAVVLLYLAVAFVGLLVLLQRVQLSVIPLQSNEYD